MSRRKADFEQRQGAMGNETLSRRLGGTMAIATLIVAVAIPLTAMGKSEKIVICHAAGQGGTENFVTLELAPQAVYGNGGHFEENGTPSAGHEGDHLGACSQDSGSTSEGTDTTLAGDDGPTTTTSSDDSTSTLSDEDADVEAVEETTTTTATEPTTTEPQNSETDVEAGIETTSTTAPSANTTPSAPGVGAGGILDDGSGDGSPQVAAAQETAPDEEDVHSETLPFTGSDHQLVFPAGLLLLAGWAVVFLTGGFREVSGAHVSGDAQRMGLGLHRGRHE